jgi:hypothetical protein
VKRANNLSVSAGFDSHEFHIVCNRHIAFDLAEIDCNIASLKKRVIVKPSDLRRFPIDTIFPFIIFGIGTEAYSSSNRGVKRKAAIPCDLKDCGNFAIR